MRDRAGDRSSCHRVQARPVRREQAPFPGRVHADAEQGEQRHHRHQEDEVEPGRTDGDLAEIQCVHEQREQRSEEDEAECDDEKRVVEQQEGLPGRRLKGRRGPEPRRAQGIQEERSTDHDRQEGEDEDAALRVGRERVHARSARPSARGRFRAARVKTP